MELTKQDLDVMVEAVEAWEREPSSTSLLGDVMGAMFCRNEEEREAALREREKAKRERDESMRVRKERSVLLRAKLIQMRDSMIAESAFA